MVLDKIEELLKKYDNGETSLQEEQQLKHYFTQETVAPHLKVCKPMFQYFLISKEEQFTKDIPLNPRKTYSLYKWISVAAVAVLMFGIYSQVNNSRSFSDLSDEELYAYNQTMEVFHLVSSKLNKGSANMNVLNLMSSNFSKGADNFTYVGEFSKTTNRLLKTNKK